MRRLVLTVALLGMVLSVVGFSLSPVFAGRPVQPTGSEQCWVDPNPVSNGMRYTVYGTGFRPGQQYAVFIGGLILMAVPDYTGAFTAGYWAAYADPTLVQVNVYQSGDRRKTVMASCSFQATGS